MTPTHRTSVSADKIPAASEPPIRVTVSGDAHIDVIKSWANVVDAWNASADVLRDVANAIQENQTDNEHTRCEIQKSQKTVLLFGSCMILIQLVATGVTLFVR